MSTVDLITAAVMEDLLSGAIPPGGWLRQDELAARLGVSKIPVREALRGLAATGLLEFRPNRGVAVPELSPADAEEMFTLRRQIEPALLRRAVGRHSPVDLATAAEALAGHVHTPLHNWRFHHALYRPAGWDRALALVAQLNAAAAPYVAHYTDQLDGHRRSADQHDQLLAACAATDAEAAATVLIAHLDAAEQALIAALER